MKKILSLAACTAMVFGCAAIGSVAHAADSTPVVAKGGAITIDGSIRMRGTSESTGATDANHSSNSYYDGTVRLGVKVQTSKAISGYVQLENGSGGLNSYAYTWGEEAGGPTSGLFTGGSKHSGLDINQAWINYMPGNWGVKVGHMPLALGDKLFFDHSEFGDDAILAYAMPNDSTMLAGIAIKFLEGSKLGAALPTGDVDGYVLLGTYKVNDGLKLGANYTLVHVGNAVVNSLNGVYSKAAKLSNLGLNVDGKAGPVNYGLDGEFQFGHTWNSTNGTSLNKAKGMAFLGKANMDVGAANVGALVGWGSGDSNPNDSKDKAFISFLSTDVDYYTLVVGDRLTEEGGDAQNGLSNMLIAQVNGSMATTCPISGKPLDLKASVSYMKHNKQVAGADGKTMGTELDLAANWHLGNGLIYGVDAGYLFAGNAFSTPGSGHKNAYALRNRLELTF